MPTTVYQGQAGTYVSLGRVNSDSSYAYNGKITAALAKISGDSIPAGASITAASVKMSSVRVYSQGYSGMRIKSGDVQVASNLYFTRNSSAGEVTFALQNAAGAFVGDSISFFMGWESSEWSGVTNYWCDIPGANVITLAVTWVAKSTFVLNSASVAAGNAVGITITPAGTASTHKMTYKLGTRTETHTLAAGVTTDSFTVPLQWCDQMPSATAGTMTVTLETFNSGVSGGKESKTLTITVPASVVPTVSSFSLNATGLFGVHYVQSKTSIDPTANGAGAYGSSVSGISYSKTGLLTEAGSLTVTATVTDSRGRTATATLTVTVYAYAAPAITGIAVFRCDEDGNPDADGAYIGVTATAAAGGAVPGNAIDTFTAAVKKKADGSYGTAQDLTNNTQKLFSGIDTVGYNVKITAADDVGTVVSTVLNVNAVGGYKLHLRADGLGMAIGKASERQNCIEIPEGWQYYINQ